MVVVVVVVVVAAAAAAEESDSDVDTLLRRRAVCGGATNACAALALQDPRLPAAADARAFSPSSAQQRSSGPGTILLHLYGCGYDVGTARPRHSAHTCALAFARPLRGLRGRGAARCKAEHAAAARSQECKVE